MTKDINDYDAYGGNIPPRAKSVASYHKNYMTPIVSEKEYRANQFDFTATQSRWVNRDLTQESVYSKLSDGFKKLFNNSRVRFQ